MTLPDFIPDEILPPCPVGRPSSACSRPKGEGQCVPTLEDLLLAPLPLGEGWGEVKKSGKWLKQILNPNDIGLESKPSLCYAAHSF